MASIRQRFQNLQNLAGFIGYHHIVIVILICAVILISIVLAGCSSYSAMTNVYIMSLSYHNSTSDVDVAGAAAAAAAANASDLMTGLKGAAQLDVRAGYFGMCVRQQGVIWLCSDDSEGLIQQIGPENDPLGLIQAVAKFKDGVLFSGILFMVIVIAFICILLLMTFPGWHMETDEGGSEVEVKPFPSRPISNIAFTCAAISAILCLVAVLWQHVGAVGAAAMVESTGYGNIKTTIGTRAMAMGWSSVVLVILAATSLLVFNLSIAMLTSLIDE